MLELASELVSQMAVVLRTRRRHGPWFSIEVLNLSREDGQSEPAGDINDGIAEQDTGNADPFIPFVCQDYTCTSLDAT